jgi:hypothetical protein
MREAGYLAVDLRTTLEQISHSHRVDCLTIEGEWMAKAMRSESDWAIVVERCSIDGFVSASEDALISMIKK